MTESSAFMSQRDIFVTEEKTFLRRKSTNTNDNNWEWGVTDEGIDAMGGEITYFEFCCGCGQLKKGDTIAIIESTKAAIELHAPCDMNVTSLADMEPFSSDKVVQWKTLMEVFALDKNVHESCLKLWE